MKCSHVRIQNLRRHWIWRHRSVHRPATPSGEGCRDRQRGRRPYPPSKVFIQYAIAEYSLAVDTKGSKTTVQGDAKVIQVDYSNNESIKHALTGVDVAISAVGLAALDIQGKIAAAGKEAGVKLFVPSEFGGITIEGGTEWRLGAKAKSDLQSQLRALGVPFTAFYTGPFADFIWEPCVS